VTPSDDSVRFVSFLIKYASAINTPSILKDIITIETTKATIAADISTAPIRDMVVRSKIRECKSADSCPFLIPPTRIRVVNRDPRVLSAWVNGAIKDAPVIEEQPVNLLFFRRGHSGSAIGISRIGQGLAFLLAEADGTKTLVELVNRAQESLNRRLPIDEVCDSFEPLERLGILGFTF
jgi:hypothetical protein